VSLLRFIVTRLLAVAAVVVSAASITFLMLRLLRPERFPPSPSVPRQLLDYLDRVFLHYDFGISDDRYGGPVSQILSKGLPADVALLAGGMLVGLLMGAAGGAVCAARPQSLAARVLGAAAAFFIIAPVYWVGLMLILTFGAGFGQIPIPFFKTNVYAPISQDPLAWLQALFVPWIVVGLPLAAMCLRMTRAAMADVLHEDFLRTASAKGLSHAQVVRRHALPAAASPVLTLVGVNMATMVTNVVLVENAFSVPGVFRLTSQAMGDGNFPLLMGMTIAGAVLVVVANLAVDVLQACIDPRVRS
jgi:peptide/nickel transport system permease protein